MPFLSLADVAERELAPGLRVRFVHTEAMTSAILDFRLRILDFQNHKSQNEWDIDSGAVLPDHGHPHEQVVNLIEGRFELTIDGETQLLTPGKVAVVPPDTLHGGRALTDCRIIDVFHPVREDYRA